MDSAIGQRLRFKPTAHTHDFVSVELAYNLRYAHKHGRQLRDPWSIRHSAIYQRCEQKTKSTCCVIIQPSEAFYCQLKQLLHLNGARSAPAITAVIHSAFLWDTERNWRQYINYLEKDLSTLVSWRQYFPLFHIIGLRGNHLREIWEARPWTPLLFLLLPLTNNISWF